MVPDLYGWSTTLRTWSGTREVRDDSSDTVRSLRRRLLDKAKNSSTLPTVRKPLLSLRGSDHQTPAQTGITVAKSHSLGLVLRSR
jgi:hypothetical protein